MNNIYFDNKEILLIPRKLIYRNTENDDIIYICKKCNIISGNLGIIIHNKSCNNCNKTIRFYYNNSNSNSNSNSDSDRDNNVILNSLDQKFLFYCNKNKLIKDKVIEQLKYILLNNLVNKILKNKLIFDVNNIIMSYL